MPKLGLGQSLGKKALTTPGVISTGRTTWAPFDYPGQTGTAYTGQALEFDGVADVINFDSIEVTKFTVAAWVNYSSSAPSLMTLTNTSGDSPGQYMGISANKIATYAGGSTGWASGSTTLSHSTWYRMVWTWDSSDGSYKMYVNGVLDSSFTETNYSSANQFIGIGALDTEATPSRIFMGMMSDFQLWDTVWTTAEAEYDYLNPEKLALDNSSTLLAYSNLKLWYPMQDSTRGQQINLMDGANTGLGSELLNNDGWSTVSGDWNADGDGSFTVNEATEANGFLAHANATLSDADSYKLTYTITNSTGTGGAQLRFAGGSSAFATENIDSSNGTHTKYVISGANSGATSLQFNENGFVGTISNISLKAINLKNHGTSVFYGDELWANDEALLSTDYGSELADLSEFASSVGPSVDGSTIVFSNANSSGAQTRLVNVAFNMGSYYKVTYTISGYSGSGNLRLSVGNNLGATRTANGTYTDILLRSTGLASTYFYANSSFTGVISGLSIVEVGSTSELRTGSEIASGALSNGKWYEITDQGWGSDLAVDGNFTTGPTFGTGDDEWTHEATDSNQNCTGTHSGSHGRSGNCMRVTLVGAGTGHLAYKRTDFVVGEVYKVTLWFKDPSTKVMNTVRIGAATSLRTFTEGDTGTVSTIDDTYKEFSTTFRASATTMYVNIQFEGNAADYGFMDDFSIQKGVDFTLFGAPDNNIGTKFLVSHADGSSVPTMDSDNKAWLLNFGWSGYPSNTHSITEEDDALRLKVTKGSAGSGAVYIYFRSAHTEFASAFVIGRQYKFTCQLKVSSGDDVNATLYDGDDATALGTYDNNSFSSVTATFTAKSATGAYFKLESMSNGDEVWISDFSIIEQGFATGWTEADAQTTIPQLAFKSYNELAWFGNDSGYVDLDSDMTFDKDNFSISVWVKRAEIGVSQAIIGRSGGQTHYMQIGTNNQVYLNRYPTALTSSLTVADTNWHHIVCTLGGSSSGNVYIDGVKDPSLNDNSIVNDIIGQNQIGVRGTDSDAGYTSADYTGCLTELALFDVELTHTEVQELYNDGEALDALTHSKKTNLTAYWRNNGLNTWKDLKGTNHGTPTGLTEHLILPEGNNGRDTQGFLMNKVRTSGLNSTNLSDSTSYIDVGATTINDSTAWSLTVWLKPDNVGDNYFISNTDYIAIISQSIIRVRADGANYNLSYKLSGETIATFTPGQWVHIGLTKGTDDELRLYVDGVLQTDSDALGNDHVDMNDPFDYRYIGGYVSGTSYPFNGVVDDLAIYTSTELEEGQVERNYKAGKRRHKN